jgi:hypothetical protein
MLALQVNKQLAKQAISGELVYGRPPVAHDFLPNASGVMFQDWQRK